VPKLDYAAPADIRSAIELRRVIRFSYKGARLEAEPHLFGAARKTSALILVLWVCGDRGGWRTVRFHDVRDLEVGRETFPGCRPGFDPYSRAIAGIDTCIYSRYIKAGRERGGPAVT
jgi:predicted DNA-binding transcriptional regulator YafY